MISVVTPWHSSGELHDLIYSSGSTSYHVGSVLFVGSSCALTRL